MDSIIRTENLWKTYLMGDEELHAIRDVNLQIKRGEALGIIGSSGSGKSTLLHLLGGVDRPTEGKVFLENKDIYREDDEALALFRRRRIGFVFQQFNLVPHLTVWENVILPLGLDNRKPDRERVQALLETMGLTEKKNNLPSQLSGGQQQRVAIARALVTQPAVLLADEPTGSLDSKTGAEVLNLLRHTAERLGQTTVIITHDDKVAGLCDRVLRIEDGVILA